MHPTAPNKTTRHRRFGLVLFAVFALAMVMGPGPGLRLINPEPNAARESLLILGVPVVYALSLIHI